MFYFLYCAILALFKAEKSQNLALFVFGSKKEPRIAKKIAKNDQK
jgi:hypothetical protein